MILYRYSPAGDLLRLLTGSLDLSLPPARSGAPPHPIDWEQLDLLAGQLLEHPVAAMTDLARCFLTTRKYRRLRADTFLFTATFSSRDDVSALWARDPDGNGFAVGLSPDLLIAERIPRVGMVLTRCGRRSLVSALEGLADQLTWTAVPAEARVRTAVLAFVAAQAVVVGPGAGTPDEHCLLALANRAHHLPQLRLQVDGSGKLRASMELAVRPEAIVEVVYGPGSAHEARALALALRRHGLSHAVVRATGTLASAAARA